MRKLDLGDVLCFAVGVLLTIFVAYAAGHRQWTVEPPRIDNRSTSAATAEAIRTPLLSPESPALADGRMTIATVALACPELPSLGISGLAASGAMCVSGVGTGAERLHIWTGTAWTK